MDKPKVAYYFFEYTHPRTGRPRKTTWRMTIEEAKKRHGDAYRPLLDTVEWREGGPGYLGPEPFHDLRPSRG